MSLSAVQDYKYMGNGKNKIKAKQNQNKQVALEMGRLTLDTTS